MLMGRIYSQKHQVTLTCIFLVICVTVILSWVAGYHGRTRLEKEIGRSLAETAYQMAEKLDREMWARTNEIILLSNLGVLDDTAAPESLQRRLNAVQARFPTLTWMGVTDMSGRIVAATNGVAKGVDSSSRPVFTEGRRGLYIGDVHEAVVLAKLLPNPSGEPLRFVDIATPLHNAKGEQTGVLAAHLSWDWVREVEQSLLEPIQERRQLEVFIISADDTVLLGPRDSLVHKTGLPSVRQAQAGKNDWAVENWPDGGPYLTGYAYGNGHLNYPGLGWSVLIRQPLDSAYKPAHDLQTQILLAGGLSAVLFALVGWQLARRITRPLEIISRAAEDMRHGVPGAAIPELNDSRETAILSHSLRALVDSLARTRVALIEMEDMAYQDRLTGLPNRRFFERFVSTSVHTVQAVNDGNSGLTFLYIDLDGFKPVNDRLGHDAGDYVLRETAARMAQCLRGNDIVARLGGDEFVAVLSAPTQAIRSQALIVAQRLIDAVNMPIHVDGETVAIGASIGIANWPGHGNTAEEAMSNADLALYRAKAAGKNIAILYDRDMIGAAATKTQPAPTAPV